MPTGIYKRSKEHRAKLSAGMRGKPSRHKGHAMPTESKEKIRKWMTGRKFGKRTRAQRKRISDAHVGIKYSESMRKKVSECNRGEKSHFWKGGKTKHHLIIRSSLEYKLWRDAVFNRDKFTCIWCGRRGGTLNADHIKSFAHHPELRFAIDNGRTLCVPCHRTTDTYGRKSL